MRVLFEKRLQRGLVDGSISLAFRRWKRSQVVAGRVYRSPVGMVDVLDVATVDGDISDADAHKAGFTSAAALHRFLRGDADARIYRIELRLSETPDQRDVLSNAETLDQTDLAELDRKLARLDQDRTWTRATLEAIARQPGRRAGDLAEQLGWPELHEFKLHVRKLKALGLTISLQIGYRLSPRGEAYLAATSQTTSR